jgi:hypothetical protein
MPDEDKGAQVTLRFPAEWRAEIEKLFGDIPGYRHLSDFYVDLIHAGLPHARAAADRYKKGRGDGES